MPDDTPAPRGIYLVASVIDSAKEVPRIAEPAPIASVEPAPFIKEAASAIPAAPLPPAKKDSKPDDAGGVPPWTSRKDGLPEGCPITPLGVAGDGFHYLDQLGQHREIEAGKHARLVVGSLFGTQQHLLFKFWPRTDREGKTTGWRPEAVAMALQVAASKRGVWDPFNKLRGAGAWLGDDGGLVLHCGDEILIAGEWKKPGEYGRHVYPTYGATLKPSPVGAKSGPDGAAARVLALLRTWNWKRKELDPWLLLGWIGAAFVGGALHWRPVVWPTGGGGTGKSTLQNLIAQLFDGGLTVVDDATAAAVRDKAQYSTLPVGIDEAEADASSSKVEAMIRLARSAASGAITMRSSSSNTAKQFIVRQCFMFGSVLVPGLQAADRSRIAILELGDLKNEAPPKLEPRAMRALGAALLQRMVDQWPRWPQALEAYRAALMGRGHNGRGADVFGTLLAAADLLSSDDEVDSDTALEWADKLCDTDLSFSIDSTRDEERCFRHLLTSVIPFDGTGARRTVAQWATMAAQGSIEDKIEAERVLGNAGLRMLKPKADDALCLMVANDHQGLTRIFQNTHWQAKSGTQGVYVQALRRLPLTRATRDGEKHRIGAVSSRGTLIDASLVVDSEYEPASGRQFDYE